ncbi:isoprenyl transferase [Telmatocola sphagniphila]|uniref:Isoprenyl transferase n=1 Tax=Telmatocola sphagniphila TaxID=1123043 RepID=A0A8E6EZF9_9BACT|nr:isoprenyl transferase [Telmatocola sphagniphila]QVL33431.1 isoprenyl transferase [Telmatocola sphagniphila]
MPINRESTAKRGLNPDRMPKSLAIVMDGNGRWALERGKERIEGHLRGVEVVRHIVTECCELGLDQLTLYCFSSENWKRPRRELEFLMALLKQYLIDERELILNQNIKFRMIGRRQGLSAEVLQELDETTRISSENTGLTLAMAINYGARGEILDAVQSLARRIKSGELDPDQIDEQAIANSLYTAGMPDPDLLIRTAGEYRISNYLLWQISYSEFWFTHTCWPDFDVPLLHQAFRDFAARERRFGGLITHPTV